jgi:hypothetical protein
MTSRLHSLAYFSRNQIQGTVEEVHAEIATILASARRHNAQHGVTGALLFSDGCFAQVLEGELDDVEAIFESIQCDRRHSHVTVLHVHAVEQRSFGHWSMAFAGIEGVSVDPKLGQDEAEKASLLLSTPGGQALLAILRSIVHRDDLARRDALLAS